MIVKKMFKTAVLAVFCGAVAFPAVSRAAAFYLYYNINSLIWMKSALTVLKSRRFLTMNSGRPPRSFPPR